MADTLQIDDGDKLQSWLEDKPAEWAQLIALRAALRVFPLVASVPIGLIEITPGMFPRLVLTIWRCLFISSVARGFPAGDFSAAANAALATSEAVAAAIRRSQTSAVGQVGRVALDAATSTANTAAAVVAASTSTSSGTRAAIDTAVAASTAIYTTAFVAEHAADPFVFARNATTMAWEVVRNDCAILEQDGSERLEAAPLWVEDNHRQDHEPKPHIAIPDWVDVAVTHLEKHLTNILGPDATLISRWYRPLYTGGSDSNWSGRFLGERAQKLALRKDAFWEVTEEREAETIMEDIAAALGWEPLNVPGTGSVGPEEFALVTETGQMLVTENGEAITVMLADGNSSIDGNSASPAATDKSFIFLSHARADRPRATAIRQMLMDERIPVWWDDDIAGGDGWRDRIVERLEKSAAVLTLWTEHSVSRDAVREEAARAQAMHKLVHARLDRADLPYGFGETHYIDLRLWDGTATHEWRKLVEALRDKLSPPDADEIRQRLSDSSPVAMVAEAGRLSPRDTPPSARPVVTNAPDLEDRMSGIRQSYSAIRPRVDSGQYQVPRDLSHSLDFVAVAINAEPLTWYAIEDSCHSLCDCMADHDAENSWNATLVKDLERLAGRLRELRPLLQPAQVPEGQPGAKPPEPEPFVAPDKVQDVKVISQQLQEILDSDEAKDVLSDGAVQLGEAGAAQVNEASRETDPDKQLPALRRGLKRMAYVTGGILTAIGGGVTINLLTAPEAAVTLAARLKPLYDMMVRFFM